MATILIALIVISAIVIIAHPLFKQSEVLDAAWDSENDSVLEGLVSRRDATYLAIKDLENDHAMGKLSDADYKSLRTRYEARAAAILQELDQVIVAKPTPRTMRDDDAVEREIARLRRAAATNTVPKCPQCGAPHAAKDVFCTKCGAPL